MYQLPEMQYANNAYAVISKIYSQSLSLFFLLFVEKKPVPVAEINVDITPLVEAKICARTNGSIRSWFRISKVYELFVLTDFPDYEGDDRVWYLLDDESLLFAKSIPDCTGKRTLDIGSGSGVLALMAARNGATSSVSIDISPRATQISQFNAKLNGIKNVSFITCDIADFKSDYQFDYITFNPPFVPVPDDVHYMLSGNGGNDGLSLVHTFFGKIDQLARSATSMGLISMSPGDEQISLLERIFISHYYGKPVTIKSVDVYGSTAPIEITYPPFENEIGFDAWKKWLADHNYTRMHYLFITLSPSDLYTFQRTRLHPPLEDLPDSGTWGAMYRVIQNSKDHA